jgi:antitoxin component of RelBE/YafQ-DinJ toxin-antitoxin module
LSLSYHMEEITKEDVIKAFTDKERKRSNLLYLHYKDRFFFKGYTAKFIARKISEDLGLTITKAMIDLISSRIIKKQAPPAPTPLPATSTPAGSIQAGDQRKETDSKDKEKVQEAAEEKFVFTDTVKDYKRNEFMEAYLRREEELKKESQMKKSGD